MTDPYEVVISFNNHDLEFVRKFAEDLRANDLNVWYADPSKYDALTIVQEKGRAVTSCKVFLVILSESSCQDGHVNDELALAYISTSTIFPVGLVRIKKLQESMDSGMKLMLAKINWVFFVKDEDYNTNMPMLVQRIVADIAMKTGQTPPPTDSTPAGDNLSPFQILNSFSHVNAAASGDEETEEAEPKQTVEFWERHFPGRHEVTWVEFKERFLRDYKKIIGMLYDSDKERFFINLMYKDIFDLSKSIKKSVYARFIETGSRDPDVFFNRLQEYGRGMYAMHEVFDMNSTLRISAVQNLGKFSTPAVVNELLKMMDDDDANIRAVAAVALARSGKSMMKAVERLMKKLREDDDRLVRESICYSLGYMQAKNAVFTILDVWRNDPIASVREAAQVALKMLDCDEAHESIYMTEVLNAEIEALKSTS